jgi:YVTN family beta-propeller protein
MLRLILTLLLCSHQLVCFSNSYFYINQQKGGSVSVFNRDDLSLKRKIPTFSGPAGIAISHNNPWIAVTHPEEGVVSFIDNQRLIPLELVNVGGSPFGAVFANQLLFYSDWSDDFVGVIHPGTGKIIKKIPVGKSPAGLLAVGCGSQVWVVNRESNSVYVIDSRNFKLIKTINVGRAPFALDFDDSYAYIVNTQGNTLSVVDLKRLVEIKQIKVGRMPYGVAVNRKLHKIYVSNQSENTVTVLDSGTHKIINTLKTGGYPENIAVDEKNQQLYVLNWFDGTLSVFDSQMDKEVKRISVGAGSRAFGKFVANPKRCIAQKNS